MKASFLGDFGFGLTLAARRRSGLSSSSAACGGNAVVMFLAFV